MGQTSHFDIVKQKVDLEEYLTNEVGVDFDHAGSGRSLACCPFHDEDSPSFNVSETDEGYKSYYCFGCKRHGTIIDAVMEKEGFEIANEAVNYLNEHYELNLERNNADYKKFAAAIRETQDAIKTTTSALEEKDNRDAKIARRYLTSRGLSDEAIQHFALGLDTEKTATGRISIPLLDKANHPISVAYRAIFDGMNCKSCGKYVKSKDLSKQRHQSNLAKKKGEIIPWEVCPNCGVDDSKASIAWLIYQNPKYLFKSAFDSNTYLYNENAAKKVIRKEDETIGVFVGEGYPEVWACYMAGEKAAVSFSGSGGLSRWQAKELIEICANKKQELNKPIILLPDFDSTGIRYANENIELLRGMSDTQEIQLIYGIDQLKYKDHLGDEQSCTDLGDILQNFGGDKVREVLLNNRMPSAEWQIRQHVEKMNTVTGQPFHSKDRQMFLVAAILAGEKSKASIDHIVPYLAEKWNSPVDSIRQWFFSNLTADNATSYQHLIKTVKQAREEAREFMQEGNIVALGFESLDKAMPGGGGRPGQLAMVLGKSGTGKAQPLDAGVLTPGGYREMGDFKIGDKVINPDGGTANVIGVFPQGERDIYSVTFSDGSSTECDIEHLWKVYDGEWSVKTLSEIIDSEYKYEIPSACSEITQTYKSVETASNMQSEVLTCVETSSKRTIQTIAYIGKKEAQCIALDSPNQLYITDDFIVTHNTMFATQILANMAERGSRSIFFTLEQASQSLYSRLACQVLGIKTDIVEELIKSDDPADEEILAPVAELYSKMRLVDNVPTESMKALPMTPDRIRAIIQETNLTHFEGEAANVVVIDYLSILQPNDDAPAEVKNSDDRVPGANMLSLFEICKETSVFMIVLQQLPKEVKKGVPFAYDSGRGGSRQTDACDYIFCIWRPDQNEELSPDDKVNVADQYKIALGKNRFGASVIEHGMFDSSCLRIMPPTEIPQPSGINAEPVIEIDGETESEDGIPAELRIDAPTAEEKTKIKLISEGEAGKDAESLAILEKASNPTPVDAKVISDIFAEEDESEIDPGLMSIYES